MGFLLYDITFLVLFSLFVVIFLYKRRKNLKREGLLYLYRTQVGIKFIDYVGTKYKKTLNALSYFVVVAGYILMLSMLYLLGKMVYIFSISPEIVRALKVPPLMPLIPYLPSIFKIDFLPPFYFTYWIIAIAIIAISHEFSHGIFAKFNGIKIKSTGFGFLGPFLAAFVEPDEKKMAKKPIFGQITILSAGSFANVVMTVLFFIIFYLFFALTFTQAGATFQDYYYGPINITSITSIAGYSTGSLNAEKMLSFINDKKLTDNFLITSPDKQTINLTQIKVGNRSYFIDIKSLESQLKEKPAQVFLYADLPAIRFGLKGVITDFGGVGIKNNQELSKEISNYKPGDKVEIKTKFNDTVLEYNLQLAEHPANKIRAFLGIANPVTKRSGVSGFFSGLISLFRESGTAYEPAFHSDFIVFIYNLLWWIIIINISVAMVNMLPVGIFDGGKVFYLSILAITRKEKIAQKLFKIMTFIILFSFLMLMVLWGLSFFL